jgi:hypothetical protein
MVGRRAARSLKVRLGPYVGYAHLLPFPPPRSWLKEGGQGGGGGGGAAAGGGMEGGREGGREAPSLVRNSRGGY